MLQRSQITSSHIKVISKNSFSASFSRFVSCTTRAPRNARKLAATRLGSAPTAGQSTQGILYIRGTGGHKIFSKAALNATGAAPQLCYISILRRVLARFQMVSMMPGALGDADASHWRDFRYPWRCCGRRRPRHLPAILVALRYLRGLAMTATLHLFGFDMICGCDGLAEADEHVRPARRYIYEQERLIERLADEGRILMTPSASSTF